MTLHNIHYATLYVLHIIAISHSSLSKIKNGELTMRKHNRKPTPLLKQESVSHCVTIIQNIDVEQLEALKTTYEFMLQAINEAICNKAEDDKRSAEIDKYLQLRKRYYAHKCMKIALMQERGVDIEKIAKEFKTLHSNRSDFMRHAAHGRALRKKCLVRARQDFLIKCHLTGIGPRPAARAMPEKLGSCSCAYACKIIKKFKEENNQA